MILKEIRKYETFTKMDLIDKFHLTSTAIGNIFTELIQANIIHEVGYGESNGGRPPVLYAMQWDSIYVIAVDIGIREISASLINLKGEVFGEVVFAKGTDHVIDKVYALIDQLLEQSFIDVVKLSGIGVSAPGPIDSSSGIILTPPNLSGANNLDITHLLEEKYRLPTVLEVDANASALAEQWFDRVNLNEDILYIFNDQGLGGSLIIDSRIYKGFGNSAGEIGHMAVDIDGPKCSCGNYGCLETLSSGIAIQKRVKANIRRAFSTSLDAYDVEGDITLERIAEHANEGDPLAVQSFEEAARYMGIGVSNAINLFAPDQVVFGGSVSALYPETIKIAEEVAKARAFSPVAKQIKFAQSNFKKHANLIGAAATIQQKLFDFPEGMLI